MFFFTKKYISKLFNQFWLSKNSKGLVFLGSLQFPENERGILWYQGFFKGPIFVSVPDRTPSISRVHTCKPFFFREGASLLAVELRPEIEGICQDLQVVKRGSEKRRRTPIFLAATAVGCIVHYKNGQLQRSIILLTLSSTRI